MKEPFEITSKNRLYNIIQAKQDIISSVFPLSSHTHSSGNSKYFYFELPTTEQIYLEPYTLISHHLSVYANPKGFLDANSEYHYTAYFKDSEGEYRLHVYFDRENNIVLKPLLAKIGTEDEIYLSCPHHEATFALHAKSSIQTLVNYLRKEQHQFNQLQNEAIEKKLNEYLNLKEKAALLQDLNSLDDKKTWISLIDEAIHKIEELSHLTELSSELLGEKKFLQDMHKEISELIIEQEARENLKQSKPKQNKNKPSQNSSNASLAQAKLIPQKPLLSIELGNLKTRYSQILKLENNKLKQTQFLENLQSLYAKLIEIELDLKPFKTTINDLGEMKKFKDQLIGKAIYHLQNLLILGKLGEVEKLIEKLNLFYQHLSPVTMAKLALATNNAALLNFLLTNKIISIHYNNFTIDNTSYASMIAYCFKKSNDKHSMLACLNVLIQHEGSLLEMDGESNLPFAANLLLNPKHSLVSAIKSYEYKDPSFYKQLNRILTALLRQTKDEKRKEEISTLIQDNDLKISSQISSSLLGDLAIETNDNSMQQIKESFLGKLIAKVLADPQVKAMNLLVQNRLNQYLKNLPFLLMLSVKKQTKDFIHHFQKSFSSITIDTNIDFNTCKTAFLEMLFKQLTLLGLSEELNQNETFLVQHPHLKKNNKQMKEALRKKAEINQKLIELNQYFSLYLYSELPSMIKKMVENPKDYSLEITENEDGDFELISHLDINVEELEIKLEKGLIHLIRMIMISHWELRESQ